MGRNYRLLRAIYAAQYNQGETLGMVFPVPPFLLVTAITLPIWDMSKYQRH